MFFLAPSTNEGIGVPFDGEYTFDVDLTKERSLGENLQLMLAKGKRGFLSLVWGAVVEIPDKTRKGYKEGALGQGFVKGIWYSLSRMHSGIYELGMFVFPNTDKTEGYAFDVDEPWR